MGRGARGEGCDGREGPRGAARGCREALLRGTTAARECGDMGGVGRGGGRRRRASSPISCRAAISCASGSRRCSARMSSSAPGGGVAPLAGVTGEVAPLTGDVALNSPALGGCGHNDF
eukprot:scaffold103799_cov48-Phaeocystis_antarctica.AAC.2